MLTMEHTGLLQM